MSVQLDFIVPKVYISMCHINVISSISLFNFSILCSNQHTSPATEWLLSFHGLFFCTRSKQQPSQPRQSHTEQSISQSNLLGSLPTRLCMAWLLVRQIGWGLSAHSASASASALHCKAGQASALLGFKQFVKSARTAQKKYR